jgi:transcriptional regulator with XRE-family HTH domain
MTTSQRNHRPHQSIGVARKYRGLTQDQFARQLTAATGDEWTRGMVAHLESGRKVFSSDLLLVVARIQDMPWEFYLYGPGGTVPGSTRSNSPNPGYINRRPTPTRPTGRTDSRRPQAA